MVRKTKPRRVDKVRPLLRLPWVKYVKTLWVRELMIRLYELSPFDYKFVFL